jgi:hypothetical protein
MIPSIIPLSLYPPIFLSIHPSIQWAYEKTMKNPGVVAPMCNSSTQADGEFKVSLGYRVSLRST